MLQLTTCWWSFCEETQTNWSKQEFVPILEDRSSVHSSLRFLESLSPRPKWLFFRILKKEILGAGVLPGSDYFSLRIITYIIKNYEALIFYNANLDIHWNVGPWDWQNMIALTEFHYMEVLFDLSVTVSAIFNNYSSSPNGLLTQRPWGREE